MARLSIALFVLLAVAAAVSAEGPGGGAPPAPHGPRGPRGAPGAPAPAGITAWLAQKKAEIQSWGSAKKDKLKDSWQHTVVPQIRQLKLKLGAEWQKKAPQISALLKEKAGGFYEKAINAANKLG